MKRIQGVILKSIDYGETSKIIYLLTNDKMESVLVKGVKRKNSKFMGLILNYNLVNCYTNDAKLPTVTDMDLIKEFRNIKQNLNKNKAAGLVVKALNQTKYDNPKIYDLFVKTLTYINDDDEFYYSLAFLIKNTYFLGITPRFNCQCGNDKDYIGFNIKEGCIVCKKCLLNTDINMDLTIQFNNIYCSNLEDKIEINNELLDFVKQYYLYHAGIAL